MIDYVKEKQDSFFGLFEFHAIEHDAMDNHIVYQACTIEKPFSCDGVQFKKGQTFHQVCFDLCKQTFSFCNWGPAEKGKASIEPDMNTSKLNIPQSLLAPLLKW